LGQTNDEAAVRPLCDALSVDPSEAVRQAVAVALKRLAKPSALPCLKQRASREQVDSVKLQITRAVEAIEASSGRGDDGAPRNVANAKFYVALSPVANQSSRPQPDVDRIVSSAVKSKLDALGAFQIAPKGESADAARAAM